MRWNGRVYEFALAAWERRERCDLYHSALMVSVDGGTFAIEMAPVWSKPGASRGVLEGPVGLRLLGRFRAFRYEVRCGLGGVIPDAAEAVDSPRRLSDDLGTAKVLVEQVPHAPTPVWGRDELGAGEMWNSNSLIAWLIVRAGLDVTRIRPPAGGRAPGWDAGVVVASRP